MSFSRLTRGILMTLFALLIGTGLAFGAVQTLNAPNPSTACDLGTCPPKTTPECDDDCFEEGYFGGACSHGCCMCLM